MAITNKYARSYANGAAFGMDGYTGWRELSTTSRIMPCGRYRMDGSYANFVFAMKFDITDTTYSPLRIRLAMATGTGSTFGSENVSWNYKFFTSESAMSSYLNASETTAGDGTVQWNKGSGQVTTVSFSRSFSPGTYYVLFWKTQASGCEIRWVSSGVGGDLWCDIGGDIANTTLTISAADNGIKSITGTDGFTMSSSGSGSSLIARGSIAAGSYAKTRYEANPGYMLTKTTGTSSDGSQGTWALNNGTIYNDSWYMPINRTIKLYSTPKTYTVSFNSNGGTGSMSSLTATYNSPFITTKCTFTRDGYTFTGWNEKADGSGTAWGITSSSSGTYESGNSWTWTYTDSIVLYAQWQAKTYTITYNSNGGDTTLPSQTKTHDVDIQLWTNGLSKNNSLTGSYIELDPNGGTCNGSTAVTIINCTNTTTYKFIGWKYKNTVYAPGATISLNTDITLVAEWETTTKNGEVELPHASRTNYVQLGWSETKDGSVDYEVGFLFIPAANNIKTLYAVWQEKELVTLTYNANGGIDAPESIVVDPSMAFIISTTIPTRQNYEFVCWCTTRDGSGRKALPGEPFAISENTILYAIWKLSGVIQIGNGNLWSSYSISIGNGSVWKQYIPYIADGSQWKVYGG